MTNNEDNTVSVIDTSSNSVISTVPVGIDPAGVAVSPDGTLVYVTNLAGNTVSVINTSNNTVTATVNVGFDPIGVAVTPVMCTLFWRFLLARMEKWQYIWQKQSKKRG